MTADTALAPHGAQTLRRSTRYRTLRRFTRHRLAMFGLVVIVLLVLACAIGPSLVPFDQFQLNMRARFREPFSARTSWAPTSSAATCWPGC